MKLHAQQTADCLEDGLSALWFNSGHAGSFLYYIGTEGSANILHLVVLLSNILFYSCFFKSGKSQSPFPKDSGTQSMSRWLLLKQL